MAVKLKDVWKDAKAEITNLVVASDLKMDLNLYTLQEIIKTAEYEPEQFPGAIVKLQDPQATILVFKNGKVVVVGCRDRKTIERALEKIYKTLKPVALRVHKKLNPKKIPYEITNMVAAADLDMDLNLFELALELDVDIEYEPEQFPGAIVKLQDPQVSLLVFKNGRIIVAGSRTKKEIERAIFKIYKLLKPFDKKSAR